MVLRVRCSGGHPNLTSTILSIKIKLGREEDNGDTPRSRPMEYYYYYYSFIIIKLENIFKKRMIYFFSIIS